MNGSHEKPTKRLVERYLREFRNSDRYYLADQAITKLFRAFPTNSTLEDVLVKTTVLNALYSTNVYATFAMAQHIITIGVDSEIAVKSPQVVDKIATVTFAGKPRRFFSFASKYCSWHDQEHYLLYDYHVEKLLLAYSRKDRFMKVQTDDFKTYGRYKSVVESFREFYALTNYSYKRLDKFLWLYGKVLFPRRYSRSQ
jgi:hypothetical protein